MCTYSSRLCAKELRRDLVQILIHRLRFDMRGSWSWWWRLCGYTHRTWWLLCIIVIRHPNVFFGFLWAALLQPKQINPTSFQIEAFALVHVLIFTKVILNYLNNVIYIKELLFNLSFKHNQHGNITG